MLTMKNIITDENPNLRKKSSAVSFPLKIEDKKIIKDLFEFVENSNNEKIAQKYSLIPSLGIAAPQINYLKRIAIVYLNHNHTTRKKIILINPKIIRHSINKIYLPDGEGCLSVKKIIKGRVPRYEKITIKSQNEDGQIIIQTLKGMNSIIAQHEIDHLNGILFYDHINDSDVSKSEEFIPE